MNKEQKDRAERTVNFWIDHMENSCKIKFLMKKNMNLYVKEI